MGYNQRYGGVVFINKGGVEPEIHPTVSVNGLVDCIHKVTIEEGVFFGHDVKLLTGAHDPDVFGEARPKSNGGGPITIHKGVWIASFAIIIGPCEIGADSVIGAGSVLAHAKVGEKELWFGNPCRFIRKLGPIKL